MELKKFMALGIKPREGIEVTKCLPNVTIAKDEEIKQVIELFEKYGYDIHTVPLSFYKMFTKSGREIKELEEVLTIIEEMDFQISEDVSLKSIFQSDLRYSCFTPSFIARLKFCIANNIEFIYEDNTFIGPLFEADVFASYTVQTPVEELKKVADLAESDYAPFAKDNAVTQENSNTEPMSLVDEEDLSIRTEIIYTLTKTMEANQNDTTLNFLITNILANLNDVIAMDNKEYRVLGTRHLVENALQGVNITPELQSELDEKVLKAFSDFSENKEGVRK